MPPRSGGRVRRRCCQRRLPSEPDVRLSTHPAQAFGNAPCRTRLGSSAFRPRMDLPVAVGVQQLQVVRRVRTTQTKPDPVMDVPGFLRDAQGLTANQTPPPLFL